MGYANSIEQDVELLYIYDNMGEISFYCFKNYSFKDLKAGDVFRLKESAQREMTRDFFGYEMFKCKSDCYYDNLIGWNVELEDENI